MWISGIVTNKGSISSSGCDGHAMKGTGTGIHKRGGGDGGGGVVHSSAVQRAAVVVVVVAAGLGGG